MDAFESSSSCDWLREEEAMVGMRSALDSYVGGTLSSMAFHSSSPSCRVYLSQAIKGEAACHSTRWTLAIRRWLYSGVDVMEEVNINECTMEDGGWEDVALRLRFRSCVFLKQRSFRERREIRGGRG